LSREPAAESRDVLSLAGIEPVDLLGRHDCNLRVIENALAGRVVVRGDQVILSGQKAQVEELKRVFASLIELVRQKKALSEDDVRYAIETRAHAESPASLASELVLVNSQRESVTPKTFGQRDYVHAIRDFDIVLAIGPAGTGKRRRSPPRWRCAGARWTASCSRGRRWRPASGWASCPATCARRSIRICARSTTRSTT
jgi:phosphate starvation-inducible protein PhoH